MNEPTEEQKELQRILAEEAAKFLARPENKSRIVAAAHKRIRAERKK